jgi:hypothetical protein
MVTSIVDPPWDIGCALRHWFSALSTLPPELESQHAATRIHQPARRRLWRGRSRRKRSSLNEWSASACWLLRKSHVDLWSLPLRQYLIHARLAAGAVRNPGSRLHLLVLREAWRCLDLLPDRIAHCERQGSRMRVKIRVQHSVPAREADRKRQRPHQDKTEGPSCIQIEPAPRHELETQVAVD